MKKKLTLVLTLEGKWSEEDIKEMADELKDYVDDNWEIEKVSHSVELISGEQ
jgi:TPP-dependent pyruvate/acetoin dehydrogenase alpha subunit